MYFKSKLLFCLCCFAILFAGSGPFSLTAEADENPPASGLVLHLPLDEGEGAVARDISGAGNHGAMVGGGERVEDILKYPEGFLLVEDTQWMEDTLRGEGHVLKFNDIGMIKVPHDESLSLEDELTLSAWVKLDAYSPEYAAHIFRKFAPGDVLASNYMLYLFGNHGGVNTASEGVVQLYAVFDGAFTTITPRYKLGTGRWYHVAASYHKEEGGRLYIDGEMVSSPFPGRGALETNEADLWITHSRGRLSDLRIYNRALSGEEVRSVVREAVMVEHVLDEALDGKPAGAWLEGRESGFSGVPGRLPGEKASRLEDCSLVWEAEADGDYFMEFWVRFFGGEGFSDEETEIAAFRAGGEDYRIFKTACGGRLMFVRGDEVLGLYPVYGWGEQEWMGDDAWRLGWRCVNIAVVDGRARLYADGMAAHGEPAELRGGGLRSSLSGAPAPRRSPN